MNFILNLFPIEVLQAIGWTLLHSLWQAVLLALLLATVLTFWKKKASNIRYAATVSTLIVLIITVLATFIISYEPAMETSALSLLASNDGILENQTWLTWLGDYFQHNMPMLVLLWFSGVAVLSFRFLGEIAYTYHLKNYQVQLAPSFWQKQTKAIAQKIGLKQSIVLKETFRVNTPMVVGIFKPIILMPIGLISGLSNEQVESILAHELAHIRRHDFLINLFQSFIEVLLFFNPAVWWISACVRAERENCCDDLAIQITGDATIYIKTLAQLEEMRTTVGQTTIAFSGQGSVLQRIRRIIYQKSSTPVLSKGFWSACVMMICLFLAVFNLESQSLIEANNDIFENEIDLISGENEETSFLEEDLASARILDNQKTQKSPDDSFQKMSIETPEKLSILALSNLLTGANMPALRDTVPNEKDKLPKRELSDSEKEQYRRAKEAYREAIEKIKTEQVQELNEKMQQLEMQLKESTELARMKQGVLKQERIKQFEEQLHAQNQQVESQAKRMEMELKMMEEEMQERVEQKSLEIEHQVKSNRAQLEARKKELEATKNEMSEEEWKDQIELLKMEEKQMTLEEAKVQEEMAMELKMALADRKRQAAMAQSELAQVKKEMELQKREFQQQLKVEEMEMQVAELQEIKERQSDELIQVKEALKRSLEEMQQKLERVEQELKSREQGKKKGTLH